LTFAIGRRFFGKTAGLLAAIVLATSVLMIILSRMVLYDITFTFFTTLSLFFICDALFGSRRKSAFLAFHVSVAFAVLTKGLLGIAIPGMAIAVFLLWSHDIARIKEFRLVSGALIIVAIVTPWCLLMEQANPGYIEYFIVNQHLGNLLGTAGDAVARHPQPFYFYIPLLLVGMFPWSFLLPSAVLNAWGARKQQEHNPAVFLLFWLVIGFLFFSSATSKLSPYVLPLFPAAALLLGRFVAGVLEAPPLKARQFTVALAIATTFILVPAVWLLATAVPEGMTEKTGIEWLDIRIAVIAPAVLTALAFFFAWQKHRLMATVATAVVAPLFVFLIYALCMPGAAAYRSSAQIAPEYDRLLPAGEDLVFSDRIFDASMFITGRNALVLGTREELFDYLKQDQRVYLLIRTVSRSLVDCEPGFAYVAVKLANKQVITNKAENPGGDSLPDLPEVECSVGRPK
jgi:4-amino-4-deoxy-L-arabinose transferase-like glycosyltransferase